MVSRHSVFRRAVQGPVVRSWLLAASTLLVAHPLFADVQWPGLRGPGYDGAARGAQLFDGGEPALEVGWKRALGSGYSSLVVGDGRVITMFAADDVDVMAAFDTQSGEELWRYTIGKTYAGHSGSHDGPISTPMLEGSKVFGLGAWGHLFALDAASGETLWQIHLVDDHGAVAPYYGFTTSPLAVDDMLVVQIGAGEGKSLAAFDQQKGELQWTLGDGEINFQSPIVATLAGQRQVLASTESHLWGVEPSSGEVLWSYEHGGDGRAMGGGTIIPVQAGEGRIFLLNKIDSSVMLQASKKGDTWQVEELWSNNGISNSYVIPVYHDGYLYGMKNRIFTCLDAATGERAWRSREPGDGFPTLVGEHLVIITKPGTLHVVEASPESYREVVSLSLFEEHSWSSVAFAEGSIYARSMGHLARIDPVMGGAGEDSPGGGTWLSATRFGAFLEQLEQASDKAAAIDAFMAEQTSFPIVEGPGVVHFVYRGEADDVGLVGDMIGFRREDPMLHVAGTDLFYYSARLETDAAVTYGFIPDFGDAIADPLNSRSSTGLFGDLSWFSMPAWQGPDYLRHDADGGRLETFTWQSKVEEEAASEEAEGDEAEGPKVETRKAEIYLPAGYDQGDRRYQVVYINDGADMLEKAEGKKALDSLLGHSVEPIIAVFVHPLEDNPRGDLRNWENYTRILVEELVPHVDATYRTIAERSGRALAGAASGSTAALFGAFKHSDVFGKVAAQSATPDVEGFGELVGSAEAQTMIVYQEWGTYHLRSPHEAWDMAADNRKVWQLLRERGYRPNGGEVPEGFSWPFWQGRTDDWLQALFPMQ